MRCFHLASQMCVKETGSRLANTFIFLPNNPGKQTSRFTTDTQHLCYKAQLVKALRGITVVCCEINNKKTCVKNS